MRHGPAHYHATALPSCGCEAVPHFRIVKTVPLVRPARPQVLRVHSPASHFFFLTFGAINETIVSFSFLSTYRVGPAFPSA